VTHYTGV